MYRKYDEKNVPKPIPVRNALPIHTSSSMTLAYFNFSSISFTPSK